LVPKDLGQTSDEGRDRFGGRGVLTRMAVFSLTVNNRATEVDVEPDTPLLWVLRHQLNLVGTKFGCGGGFCGACTVHVEGEAIRSCQLPVAKARGRRIITIEGLSSGSRQPAAGNRETTPGTRAGLHPVQRAWAEIDVPQCGYCQAGQMMTAAALLARTPNPTDADIVTAMNGNLCRCGTYLRIRQAIRRAAEFGQAGGQGGRK
jgi:isoquinoline 1-oxidoreductase alpha subunit